jgi:YgiT-type zinc finger domain-containing protein
MELLEEIVMAVKPIPVCGEHRVPKEWRPTTFEYSDEGISIRVPNVYAWVCPVNGEASFTPETVDELIGTVRELLETAKRARERRSVLTEYIVSVSQPVTLKSPA